MAANAIQIQGHLVYHTHGRKTTAVLGTFPNTWLSYEAVIQRTIYRNLQQEKTYNI